MHPTSEGAGSVHGPLVVLVDCHGWADEGHRAAEQTRRREGQGSQYNRVDSMV
jgi:hypothetical protein